MKTNLNESDRTMFLKWVDEHDAVCSNYDDHGNPLLKPEDMEERISLVFTQTREGALFKVKCSCGSEGDLTDYAAW